MSEETDALADLFLDVTEKEEVIETQKEGPSHAPVEDTSWDGIPKVTRDGLEDAVGTAPEGDDQPP